MVVEQSGALDKLSTQAGIVLAAADASRCICGAECNISTGESVTHCVIRQMRFGALDLRGRCGGVLSLPRSCIVATR